jgi:hypothetical protein
MPPSDEPFEALHEMSRSEFEEGIVHIAALLEQTRR